MFREDTFAIRATPEHPYMDLRFTDQQQAFREEARTWLEANVPAEPLKSFDTEEGFQQHREWEAKLN